MSALTATRYLIGKRFIEGALEGMLVEDDSPVSFEVGQTYGGGWLGSRYVVESCEELLAEARGARS